ncbi:MAG: hypothetical protein AB7G23_21050 [Vicinamibacterales bacterium]
MSRLPWHQEVQILALTERVGAVTVEQVVRECKLKERVAAVRLADLVRAALLAHGDDGFALTIIGRAELADRVAKTTRGEAPKGRPPARSTSKLPPLADESVRGYVGISYIIGSETSRDGAEDALSNAHKVKAKVWRELAAAGRAGLTPHELIAAIPEHAEGSVRNRCNELVIEGYAEDSGERRLSPKGKFVVVWRLIAPPDQPPTEGQPSVPLPPAPQPTTEAVHV